MSKPTMTSRRLIRLLPLAMLLMTLMSLSGCVTRTRIIAADQMETFVKGCVPFTPVEDGVFMNLARYQRYRNAVADKILIEQTK